uniref:Uncharacterized protein n=2 Tax=Oryza TaxID=4527 RepID=Q6ZLB9_ORYSJ|nr:hypothetical protein [Oryza sativa Japonica Group]
MAPPPILPPPLLWLASICNIGLLRLGLCLAAQGARPQPVARPHRCGKPGSSRGRRVFVDNMRIAT